MSVERGKVAWASPSNGIELVAVRDTNAPDPASDVSSVLRVVASGVTIASGLASIPLVTLSQFPSLGYRSNEQSLPPDGTTLRHVANLAWQAGSASSSYILYTGVGATFPAVTPPLPAMPPTLARHENIEHVSRNLPGCLFRHPCVAVDSLRVGVAFEMRPSNLRWYVPVPFDQWIVVLRFHDSVADSGQNVWRNWNTPAYYFSDQSNDTADYLWPSVTQFPSIPRATLLDLPDGGLVWLRDSAPSSGMRVYRYNELAIWSMPEAAFPTMVHSPFVQSDGWHSSGILYRDPNPGAYERPSPFGGYSWYYAGRHENAPGSQSPLFSELRPGGGGIYAHVITARLDWSFDYCELPSIMGGIIAKPIGGPQSTQLGPGGRSPMFFTTPGEGATDVTTFDAVAEVTRMGVFAADTESVIVERLFCGSDSLISWLDDEPYDSTMGRAADLLYVTELVRDSDNVVLWRSDTVTARMVGDSVRYDSVTVPVDTAGIGTEVFIRLRAFATDSLRSDISGGFVFLEPGIEILPRRVRPGSDAFPRGNAAPDLTMRVIPNPLRRGIGEVRLQVEQDGTVTLWLTDIAGRRLRPLASLTPARPGSYGLRDC